MVLFNINWGPGQVTPTAKYNCDGYEFLWTVGDIWRDLQMTIKWYQWHAKNVEQLCEVQNKWAIAPKHCVRNCSYKGHLEHVFTFPGLKYDCLSTLGLLCVLGCLLQIRGLAKPTQTNVLSLLRSLCSLAEWPTGLPILPDLVLDVQGGYLSLDRFWPQLTARGVQVMKTRFGCG